MRFNARDYQRAVAVFMVERLGAAIFADPGTGKTGSSLTAVKALSLLGLTRRTLIVAPKRVVEITWPDEVRKWAQFNGFRIKYLTGEHKRKNRIVSSPTEITLTTPDNLPWIAKHVGRAGCPWDTLLVDESTKFKNNSAKRFKALKSILPAFNRRYILTGTPTPKSAIDLWAQIYILDLGATLGKSLNEFHKRFCFKGGFKGREWILHSQAQAEIERLIAPFTLRIDRDDYLDMPDLIINDVWVDLPTSLFKEYRTLERKLFVQLDSGEVFSPGDSGSSYRLCRQFVNGGFYVSEEFINEAGELARRNVGVENKHTCKIDTIRDILDELQGKPVLIGYLWNHDLDRIRKAFGPCPVINGDTTTKEAQDYVARWNRKEIPILCAQYQAMSHGLNMQTGGNDIICFGLPDDQEIYQQFIERVYRSGVVGTVRVHRILCRKTIDEAVAENNQIKSNNQRSLLDALKAYRQRI